MNEIQYLKTEEIKERYKQLYFEYTENIKELEDILHKIKKQREELLIIYQELNDRGENEWL